MPHTKHYSHRDADCEIKPPKPPPPPAPPPPPPPPPPPLTRADMIFYELMGDFMYCRLGMTFEEARQCHLSICWTQPNDHSELRFYDCDLQIYYVETYFPFSVCTLSDSWTEPWPGPGTCDACTWPDPPCP